jgi:spore coat protein H
MIQRIVLVSFSFWFGFVGATGLSGHDLKFKNLFPSNRVLQIKINVAEDDWESIRYVRRDLRTELAPERQFGPLKGPYEYIMADIVIDGVKFKNVRLRKKGLLGSQSVTRPSFKIKLNYKNKKQDIDGYSLLTLNNNQQDPAGLSQFMGYRFFQKAGLAAPRCALAHVTFNGNNFGVYTHVESAKAPLAQNNFGNSNGTLYEGTVNDFHLGWEDSFDRKFGDDSPGKKRLKALIQSLEKAKDGATDNFDLVKSVEASVDLDHFFKYWAVESLLGFWDGYSGNRNNFFIYVNSENDKIYFLPWGGDCMFQKYSMVDRDPRLPLSVKTKGMLAYHLYQNESARERYRTTLLDVLSIHWNEAELLDESERVQQMAEPYFTGFQKSRSNRDAIRRFIRNRRDEVMDEIADGMPNWDRKPGGDHQRFGLGAKKT